MRISKFYTLFLFSIISCTQPIQTRQFYLPIAEFKSAKTYIYKSEDDTLKIEYWKKTKINKDEILTTRKNKSGKLIDKVKEILTDNGSNIKSYEILYKGEDWINSTKLHLIENCLMKWDLNLKSYYSGQFYINHSYWNISRNREFYKNEIKSFNERDYETLVFKDTYKFSLEITADNNEFIPKPKFKDFIQYSYFAKGIGLIEYNRVFDDGEKETMKLVEIQ